MVHKSHIIVANLSDTQPSNFQLIIKGIEPQQKFDLCTDHCTNLTWIETVNPRSTRPNNTGSVSAGPGEFPISYSYIHKQFIVSAVTK